MTTSEFSHLLSPLRIGPMEARNRMVSTAHGTSMGRGNRPTRQLIEYQATRSKGGIGLIIMEAARVHPSSQPNQSSLTGWDEGMIPDYRAMADAVHAGGAKLVTQLVHMGRQASSLDSLQPLWSASAIPSATNPSERARAMTREDIDQCIRSFAACAVNMKRAGMDGVEVHGAHGYLVAQFLSPLTNLRTDEYGGSLRNRTRFALEVCQAVRKAAGRDFAIGIRLSADEMVPGGLRLEDTVQIARWLEDAGDLDFLDISQGTQGPGVNDNELIADMSWPEAPFTHLAEGVKKATRGIPVFTVGRIIDPKIAERVLAEGKADMVCMTRAHIADPEIGRKLTEGRYEDIRFCIGCNQGCIGRRAADKPVGCTINAEAGREHELAPITPAATRKSVAIVGGGVAGMEAARVAALRGHRVTLFERQGHLGGQVKTLVKAPNRQGFEKILVWLERQVKKLGVDVRLNADVSAAWLAEQRLDAIIVAAGSVPSLPSYPGMDGPGAPRIASVDDVLEGRIAAGTRAVLVDEDGHHKAMGTSELMADAGAQVHHVAAADRIGYDVVAWSRNPALKRLRDRNVTFHRGVSIRAVEGRSVILRDLYNGDDRVIADVDLIVVARPNVPSGDLLVSLQRILGAPGSNLAPQLLAVGDCVVPRKALEAIREGNMAARRL